MVPASVAAALIARAGLDGTRQLAHLPREDRRRLVHALVAWPIAVTGTRGYNYAEVTAGGVSLNEIDPSTMRSRICPGLYLVGEILDVDGRIGSGIDQIAARQTVGLRNRETVIEDHQVADAEGVAGVG